MNKQEILDSVRELAAQKQISQEELQAAFASGSSLPVPTPSANQFKLSNILYYIGGAIVFLGICVLIYQNWDSFSSPLRILVTLGSMVACFFVGAVLYKYENFRELSQAFFLISGMLAPLGVEVALNEWGADLSSNTIQLMVFVLLVLIFLAGFYFFRQTILLFFGIVFASVVFHYLVNIIIGNSLGYVDQSKVWEYFFLALGLAYMFLGYYLSSGSQRVLSGVMYGFGSIFFLGSAMALGGWQPNQNAFWELVYPLLVFGIIFLSVYLKSKGFLVFGSLFLIAYILKLTGEYFSSGLGWPLALVIAGLAIMAVGYYAVKLNKKYLKAA